MMRALALLALLSGTATAQDAIEAVPLDDGVDQPQIILLPEGSSQGQIVEREDGSEAVITSPIDGSSVAVPDVQANTIQARSAPGALLKGLDKVSGEVTDLEMKIGETAQVGRIAVTVGDCRYPEDNPAGEGYAWVKVEDPSRGTVLFQGWMIASSPALNALDHPRYDVWVIRCTTA
jgi:hypothetical protein